MFVVVIALKWINMKGRQDRCSLSNINHKFPSQRPIPSNYRVGVIIPLPLRLDVVLCRKFILFAADLYFSIVVPQNLLNQASLPNNFDSIINLIRLITLTSAIFNRSLINRVLKFRDLALYSHIRDKTSCPNFHLLREAVRKLANGITMYSMLCRTLTSKFIRLVSWAVEASFVVGHLKIAL